MPLFAKYSPVLFFHLPISKKEKVKSKKTTKVKKREAKEEEWDVKPVRFPDSQTRKHICLPPLSPPPSFASPLLVATVRRSSTPAGARCGSCQRSSTKGPQPPLNPDSRTRRRLREPWVADSLQDVSKSGGGATRLPPASYHGKAEAWGWGTRQVGSSLDFSWWFIHFPETFWFVNCPACHEYLTSYWGSDSLSYTAMCLCLLEKGKPHIFLQICQGDKP